MAFDTEKLKRISAARMDHLRSLNLLRPGDRVLDVGCGIGHLAEIMMDWGCQVAGVDARPGNVARCRFPAHVSDVTGDDMTGLGVFDAILAYGLLYHLTAPRNALKRLGEVDAPLLFVETVVSDETRSRLNRVTEEAQGPDQSLAGEGCRPSPSYVVNGLRMAGYPHVYTPKTLPIHPEYQWVPQGDGAHKRGGHYLRVVFVAAREPLDNGLLDAID